MQGCDHAHYGPMLPVRMCEPHSIVVTGFEYRDLEHGSKGQEQFCLNVAVGWDDTRSVIDDVTQQGS